MKKFAPVNVIVHYPKSQKGQRELRRRVAIVHADAVLNSINKLKCPQDQKIKLLDAIIADVKKDIEEEKRDKTVTRAIEKEVHRADFVVNGYAFYRKAGKINVVNLNDMVRVSVLSEGGEVLKSSMDPIEISIIKGYWEKNKQFAEE